ncbi:disulfide bond formation protein DsbA [Ilumatobacter sp.]|uniref:mycothiol-dependent nitroreductase Rv2466c family protein n=1 Tax=Ilumatobacter sp. TaxID=1967498 RepID=UPI003AF82B12
MTARWVVEEVAPARDLKITWQPISLMVKNEVGTDSDHYEPVFKTHRMLRVMEAVRAELGEDAVQRWYLLSGTTVHHDDNRDEADLADMLEHLGFDRGLADAADDEKWDAEITSRMDQGLALVGDDVGTPIIAFTADDGVKRGIFGPVITRVPTGEQALKVWDSMHHFTTMDGFWELKRTRTERPEFGDRPDI